MIDPDRLREMSASARKLNDENRAAAEAAEARAQEIRVQAMLNRAESNMTVAAMKGERRALVARLDYKEYRGAGTYWNDGRGGWGYRLDPSNLLGAARVVYDTLLDKKLAPELEFWHDGCGVQSGFELYANW